MALTDQVLHADSLRSADGYTYLNLGLPWFRSLPWGAVANLTVSIDATTYQPSEVYVLLDGQYRPLSELADSAVEWFVQDRHDFRVSAVMHPGGHRVALAFQLVMPNLFAAPGQAISFPSRVEQEINLN